MIVLCEVPIYSLDKKVGDLLVCSTSSPNMVEIKYRSTVKLPEVLGEVNALEMARALNNATNS